MQRIRVACLLYVSLLVLYTFMRTGFCLIHFQGQLHGADIVRVFYWGMRLDFTALFYINLLFYGYYFFLHNTLPVTIRTRVALVLFLLLNIPFIAINFIDLGYYSFNNHRSTVDLVFVMADSIHATGAFFKDYWYLFILFVIAIFLLTITARRLLKSTSNTVRLPWYRQYGAGLVTLLFFVLIARGTATRPIMPSTPLLYIDAGYQPLASNSSLTFLYSVFKRQTQLKIKNYFPAQTIDTIFTIKRQYTHAEPFQRKNVVIIMLESFCREYLDDGSIYRAKTPFLDSVIAHSTWCSNAYANGFTSNQGMVSLIGSMPPLLDEPYYQSIYNGNRIRGIGTVLKEQGYSTHFFYGANNDHFGFGKFCKMMGIDQQHTRNDFNDERYYDGNWGIFDHRFLPFAGNILQRVNTPFLAVLYNISSHPPFTVPADIGRITNVPGQKPSQQAVTYVDYSLRLFFDQIKSAAWYKNTVFVFCADHSLVGVGKKFVMHDGIRIPIFIYDPNDPVHRTITRMVQQIDLVPTILDRLAYSKPFLSFGHSIYDSTAPQYAVCKSQGLQLIDSTCLFRFDPVKDEPVCLYKIGDTALKNNLLNQKSCSPDQDRLLRYSKAVIQRYNNAVIQNQLYVK
ncbi:Phosphoglycerol transferase MdoB [Niastella yeongjuensis]|nr:Phosphoglycerol transferase MdoB [Niastella yeongjuensis]